MGLIDFYIIRSLVQSVHQIFLPYFLNQKIIYYVSASFMITNWDPWDGFSNPTLHLWWLFIFSTLDV